MTRPKIYNFDGIYEIFEQLLFMDSFHNFYIIDFSAGIQTIDSTQALFLPIGASVSLLVMFFFFDSVQVVFTICTAGNYLSWT